MGAGKEMGALAFCFPDLTDENGAPRVGFPGVVAFFSHGEKIKRDEGKKAGRGME